MALRSLYGDETYENRKVLQIHRYFVLRWTFEGSHCGCSAAYGVVIVKMQSVPTGSNGSTGLVNKRYIYFKLKKKTFYIVWFMTSR